MSKYVSKNASKARERLIETASELFYARGFTNVGINEIFEKAGVARGTLYYNFASKRELIRAVLERRLAQRLEWLEAVKNLDDPAKQLEKAVEMHLEWMQSDSYRGCSFLNALIEMGAEGDEVRDLTLEQKEAVRTFFEGLASRAGLNNSQTFSHELMLVIDGATVTSLFREPEEVAVYARRIIRAMSSR